MLKIAICDDEVEYHNIVQNYVKDYLNSHNLKYDIDLYNSGKELLNSKVEDFDIIFLDVQMGETQQTDGMHTAMKIRKKNNSVIIIFVLIFIKYAPLGYQVSAIRYVLKSDLQYGINESMDAALNQLFHKADSIQLKWHGKDVEIPLSEIYYFESDGRRIKVIMDCEDQYQNSFYEKISTLALTLEQKGFIQCHKSFIVNIDKVDEIERYKFTLTNGNIVPISRDNYLRIHRSYYLQIAQRGGL